MNHIRPAIDLPVTTAVVTTIWLATPAPNTSPPGQSSVSLVRGELGCTHHHDPAPICVEAGLRAEPGAPPLEDVPAPANDQSPTPSPWIHRLARLLGRPIEQIQHRCSPDNFAELKELDTAYAQEVENASVNALDEASRVFNEWLKNGCHSTPSHRVRSRRQSAPRSSEAPPRRRALDCSGRSIRAKTGGSTWRTGHMNHWGDYIDMSSIRHIYRLLPIITRCSLQEKTYVAHY